MPATHPMDWKTTAVTDKDARDRLQKAGWEVYQTVPGPPTEYRLRIPANEMDVEAGAARPEAQGYDPLDGIDFASDAAMELAVEAELEAADFEPLAPSGKTGYTKADVQSLTGAE